MNEELSLERRVELIEKELDIYPSEQDFKDRVESHRSKGLEFDHFEDYGIAVFRIKGSVEHRELDEISEKFGSYQIDPETKEVVVYHE